MFNFLKPSPPKKELLLIEAQQYVDQINKIHSVPTIQTKIFLNANEKAVLEDGYSTLSETRAVRKSSGGYTGFRVAKGVTIGSYSGSSSSEQQWKNLDHGSLTVTNQRIIFTGNQETREVPLSKILSAEIDTSFLGTYLDLKTKNRKKAMRFKIKGNHYIWSAVFQLIKQGADITNLQDKVDVQYI